MIKQFAKSISAWMLLGMLVMLPFLSADEPSASIIDLLRAMGNATDGNGYSRLWEAIQNNPAVANTLQSGNGMTFFAPNNDAMDAALKQVNSQYISEVLLYHLATSPIASASDVHASQVVDTRLVSGQSPSVLLPFGSAQKVALSDNGNGILSVQYGTPWPALSLQPGVQAQNGVIYPMNAFLMPPGPLPKALDQFNLSSFKEALDRVGMGAGLTNMVGLTIFVPSSEILHANSFNVMVDIDLTNFLQYHVIPNQALYDFAFTDGASFIAQNGKTINVTNKDGVIKVNDNAIISSNLLLNNGVMHIIDGILNPYPNLVFNLTRHDSTDSNKPDPSKPVKPTSSGQPLPVSPQQSDAVQSSMWLSSVFAVFSISLLYVFM